MFRKIYMKKVRLKDLERVYNIILECTSWLRAKGIEQWNPIYPKNLFEKDIKEGKVYYFISDDRLIGTVTLSTNKPFYYPKNVWKRSKKAMYIAKLAVPRKLKNMEIGNRILMEIERKAKTMKIKKLRLDIIKSNRKLKDYYTIAGFKNFKYVSIKETPSLLMEKEI